MGHMRLRIVSRHRAHALAVGRLVIATRVVQREVYHRFSATSVVRGATELWIAGRAQDSLCRVSLGYIIWEDRDRGTQSDCLPYSARISLIQTLWQVRFRLTCILLRFYLSLVRHCLVWLNLLLLYVVCVMNLCVVHYL